MTVPYQFEVTVLPEYMGEHSAPESSQFVFAYHITIRNIGSKSARLVIGEQPMIKPGAEHAYSSFCVLETPLGCMQGSYQMLGEDGKRFNADIPVFTLAKEGVLH